MDLLEAASQHKETARLKALARVAGAAAHGGGLSGVLQAITEGIRTAFELQAVLNLLEEDLDSYVVRAMVGEGRDELMGSATKREAFEELLAPRFEVVPDVYFIPHDAAVNVDGLGASYVSDHPWAGPGHWHPEDMCFVRMRTSEGKALGIISLDSPQGARVPDAENFELLRLFSMVGANAAENVLLLREISDLETEREMKELRQELLEEVELRRSLLEIGTKLGAASAGESLDIFPVLAQRLNGVVPIKSLTIYAADSGSNSARPIYFSEDSEDADAIMSFSVPSGVGATGTAVLRRKTVISNVGDPVRAKVEVPDTDPTDEHLLAVPVLVEEQVKAVLTLARDPEEPPFVALDARRAELFAQHVALSLLLTEVAQSRRLLSQQVNELEDLNTLKDEFVANVSHELRTPLTAVIGNVVTVAGLGDMLSPDERAELLIAAERQAKRLAELLENLLAQSRLAGDDPAVVPVVVRLKPFLEEVADTLRFRSPERSIETEVSGPEAIVSDRTLLYRILFNLGDNALKYSDGPVHIESRGEPDGVRIEVIDHGEGIDPADIPRVFEQFHQLDGSNLRRVGGVGLGLHLCARAAEALGGRVEVESERGRGSTFALRLPLGSAS